jgi:hypothetical protein
MSETIKKLRKNKQEFEEVLRWIVEKEHDKKYKKCNSLLSSKCIKVGLATQFHGRRCPECSKAYKRQNYASNKNDN